MKDTVQWFLELAVNENKLEDLKMVMNEMIESTKNEQGVLAYEWHFGQQETTVSIYERYENSEAVLAHMNNFSVFAERFHSCVTQNKLTMLGNPNDAVRNLFSAASPVYMETKAGFARFN